MLTKAERHKAVGSSLPAVSMSVCPAVKEAKTNMANAKVAGENISERGRLRPQMLVFLPIRNANVRSEGAFEELSIPFSGIISQME